MVTSQQLIPYRFSSDDYSLTEQLKAQFLQLRQERQPLYLKKVELDTILRWKLRGQYDRQRKNHLNNTEEVIRSVTGAALSISHPDDPGYELELQVNILCTLRGIGIPVASAVLALIFPEKYAVVDFRGWRQVFDENRAPRSVADYKRYLKKIHSLSEELGWLPQEVDLAIWEYDRVNSKRL